MTWAHVPRAIAGMLVAAAVSSSAVLAQAPAQPGAPPASPLGALAPENLKKPRPAPPFDITGTWFVDLRAGRWQFGPPYPKLKPEAQKHLDAFNKAGAEGKVYRDDIGHCWPAGVPIIMTRVWPIAMVQVPTAVYMISGFMNSFRTIFLDGRTHTDPDIVVRTFNGESIGHWEADALVVETKNFIDDEHRWVDPGVRSGAQLTMIERIKLINDGKQLEIAYTLTDPEFWEGEWKATRRWNRVTDTDVTEVECLPDLNEHLPSTSSKVHVR
jgi:hypothetical protein